MNLRRFNLETDYPMICEWWTKHKSPVLPKAVFLPAIGLISEAAAGFLFVPEKTQGGIGIIEFTTTDPDAHVRVRLESVKSVYAGLEGIAKEMKCGSLMSFVAQGRSEEHLLLKRGWADVTGIPHLIFGKALCP